MNTLDILYIFIMTVSLAVSAFRGGVREFFSLAAVALGFVAAANFYHFGAGQLLRLTSHEEVNSIISFMLIFLFVALLVSYVGGQLSHLVKKKKLGFWNLMAGTAIGSLKGLFVCALLTYMLLVFMKPGGGFFSGSRAFPFMSQIAIAVAPIGPKNFREEFEKKLNALYEKSVPVATGILKGEKQDAPKKDEKPKEPAAPAKTAEKAASDEKGAGK